MVVIVLIGVVLYENEFNERKTILFKNGEFKEIKQ